MSQNKSLHKKSLKLNRVATNGSCESNVIICLKVVMREVWEIKKKLINLVWKGVICTIIGSERASKVVAKVLAFLYRSNKVKLTNGCKSYPRRNE